jgi:hypothetical protein
MSEELVERVARKAVCGSRPMPSLNCVEVCAPCERIARAAIAIVLEEAAKVAKHYRDQDGAPIRNPITEAHDIGWDGACEVIEAAIRAMIKG